jgi:hypothetical protein
VNDTVRIAAVMQGTAIALEAATAARATPEVGRATP